MAPYRETGVETIGDLCAAQGPRRSSGIGDWILIYRSETTAFHPPTPIPVAPLKGCNGEEFRMPARRDLSARSEGKPSESLHLS